MKKRILITNGHMKVGGVEKSLVNLLNAIDYSKYCVDLILFEGAGEYYADIPKEVNVIICDLTETYGNLLQVIWKSFPNIKNISRKMVLMLAGKINQKYLRYLVKTGEYDVALAYRVGIPMDFISYGVKAKKKYFWWHHGEFNYPDWQAKHWQESARNMNGIIYVSKSIRDIVEPHFSGYLKESYIVPNSISKQEISSKAEVNLNLPDSRWVIVSAGRFSEEKHMRDCVFAAKELNDRGYRDFRWYLLGDGPEKEGAYQQIIEFGLQNNVVCLGNIANPYPYFRIADIVVHPSFVESQGITVLEAMSLKKLVVAVDSNGVKEYASDHENALIAEKSVESLTQKIIEGFTLNELAKKSICDAAEKTADLYCSETIMQQIERDLFGGQ